MNEEGPKPHATRDYTTPADSADQYDWIDQRIEDGADDAVIWTTAGEARPCTDDSKVSVSQMAAVS
jgi:hypothetical protein